MNEAMKKSLNEQKHFTQRRKVAEGAKKTKQLSLASLCALASLREIVYLFTASNAQGQVGMRRKRQNVALCNLC
jgi:hypothetical protein